MRATETDLLLVTDVQPDFCPGGRLPVPEGHEVVRPVNRLIELFPHVAATQDWHPPGHMSFASSHPGRAAFETVQAPYGPQTLWPDHCIQGTPGADLHPDLLADRAELIIRKGFRAAIDSYSAFRENDRATPTGLAGYLRERGISRLVLVGLALDFCVRWSAEDARAAGFEVVVVTDACRAIDTGGSLAEARAAMAAAEVSFATAADFIG